MPKVSFSLHSGHHVVMLPEDWRWECQRRTTFSQRYELLSPSEAGDMLYSVINGGPLGPDGPGAALGAVIAFVMEARRDRSARSEFSMSPIGAAYTHRF